MSDFKVSSSQRQRLLAGDYTPLDFDTKPYELEPGAVYVLAWERGQPAWEPGHGVRALRVPVWFITVTVVQRHRKGFWRARFDVTDNRDPDVFLRRIGGYNPDAPSSYDELKAGAVPDWTPSMLTRAKTVNEFWSAERLKRHADEQRERGRERSRARRKRAA